MRKVSILFLKSSILLVTLPMLLLALYGLYELALNPVNPRYASMLYPVIAGVYLSLIPLLWIFLQFYQLLHLESGKNEGESRIKILERLRRGSLFFGSVFLVTEPFVFLVAQEDDAPGLILVFLIPVFFALVLFALVTLFLDKEDRRSHV